MKKILVSLAVLTLCFSIKANAQEQVPDWKRWHYLSEEEMHTPVRNENFTETPPPTGEPRFVAEFEPMQGVMISYAGYYGFGIPVNLIKQLADNCHLYCVVASSNQSSAQSTMQSGGVNMSNVTFVNAPVDSYWIRDYGPWYIFEDRDPAIVDNRYNRNRPNDDNISGVFATYWDIPMYGMNLTHTGGNMMEDGRGHGVSDELVVEENSYNETNVRNKMRDYLGIDPYHITIDPQGDYIAHVDCWGKYLAPDKILIAQLPTSDSHYADYEAVAEYFATTNCCWGYPYHVYRVYEPGGSTLAPYTNSLILNKTVYVPMGSNSTYNQQALNVYQEALPGYTIVGVTNNNYSIAWQNTDALHCRTRGVMDFDMLYVDHRDVVFGEQEMQNSIAITSKFIAYSGQELKQDSLLVYYSIDGGDYQVAHMIPTGNDDEYVGYITGYEAGSSVDYYVFGADESGHRYTQPVFAELEPHHFTIEAEPQGELTLSVNELVFDEYNTISFTITNNTSNAVAINGIDEVNTDYLTIEPSEALPYTLEVGASLNVNVGAMIQPAKGYVYTAMEISSDLGVIVMPVSIDDKYFGITENEAASFELYPNPMSNTLFINGDVQDVTIFNAVGQQVLFVENSNEIDVETLSEGLYFVRVSDKKGNNVVKKIVKK
ncbi:MAG: agmatine deiminase family protein [Bacteroidales bacterium]|nr:agmatine deiminase family protein [Bacteroidales bacterium]